MFVWLSPGIYAAKEKLQLFGVHMTAELGSLALAIATAVLGAVALVQYLKAYGVFHRPTK